MVVQGVQTRREGSEGGLADHVMAGKELKKKNVVGKFFPHVNKRDYTTATDTMIQGPGRQNHMDTERKVFDKMNGRSTPKEKFRIQRTIQMGNMKVQERN